MINPIESVVLGLLLILGIFIVIYLIFGIKEYLKNRRLDEWKKVIKIRENQEEDFIEDEI